MHERIIRHGSEDHNGKCYKIKVTMTGCIITKTKSPVTATPISAEHYLRNEIMKDKKWCTDNKLNKLIGKFATIQNDEKNKQNGHEEERQSLG